DLSPGARTTPFSAPERRAVISAAVIAGKRASERLANGTRDLAFDSRPPAWQGSPPFDPAILRGTNPLANPELGPKQVCPSGQPKFYDLNKRPAHCPKCATEFGPDEAIRNRRVRARATTPEPEAEDEREDQVAAGAAADEEEEEEDTVTPELDEVADEPP